MRVVYFPAELTELKRLWEADEMKPIVHFGVIEDETNDGTLTIQLYEGRDYRTINGVPFADFESETVWRNLPKKWTYSDRLYKEGVSEKWNEWTEVARLASIKNPHDIINLIKNGWLIRSDSEEALRKAMLIDEEIEQKKYRIVKKYPSWTQTYGNHKPTYKRLSASAVYDNYDDAELACKMVIQDFRDILHTNDMIDNEESIQWVLGKIPEGHRERAEMILKGLPMEHKFMLRHFENTILWQPYKSNDWIPLYKYV